MNKQMTNIVTSIQSSDIRSTRRELLRLRSENEELRMTVTDGNKAILGELTALKALMKEFIKDSNLNDRKRKRYSGVVHTNHD